MKGIVTLTDDSGNPRYVQAQHIVYWHSRYPDGRGTLIHMMGVGSIVVQERVEEVTKRIVEARGE